MTPFKDNGRLNGRQKRFNVILSSKRVTIERAFALLKGRFRRLKFLKMWGIRDTVYAIIAACVLHNMCLTGGDIGDDLVDNQGDVLEEGGGLAAEADDRRPCERAVAARNRYMETVLR